MHVTGRVGANAARLLTMNTRDDSDDRQLSRRVNSARLPEYVDKNVRLACKILKVRSFFSACSVITWHVFQVDGERLTVEASDGGQVNVLVPLVSYYSNRLLLTLNHFH